MLEQEQICYRQYNVVELSQKDRLQLLMLHAFNEQKPPEDILDCAKQLVEYVGGVPLALEVL
ncbi:hypothetical protein, partial [Vibrio vulnificus]|uniref:hypothetical protein n=1 Tax=Vibrio vulnificus TaxID=672 RepID=UPI001F51361D